jgi:hypothetical protein
MLFSDTNVLGLSCTSTYLKWMYTKGNTEVLREPVVMSLVVIMATKLSSTSDLRQQY